MATTRSSRKLDHIGFDIAVKGADGVRHTMLGFETEEEAWTWIKQDQQREANLAAPH